MRKMWKYVRNVDAILIGIVKLLRVRNCGYALSVNKAIIWRLYPLCQFRRLMILCAKGKMLVPVSIKNRNSTCFLSIFVYPRNRWMPSKQHYLVSYKQKQFKITKTLI